MTELTQLSLSDARDGLTKGDFSAVELTQAHIEAMDTHRDLNAYITELPELALERAKEADYNIGQGQAGALEGLPLGIKIYFAQKASLLPPHRIFLMGLHHHMRAP